MYICQKMMILLTILWWSYAIGLSHNVMYNDNEMRVFHILSEDRSPQISCPVDQCYSLQDVINNQSYFFDSNTTLELLPGNYDITQSVGVLVIVDVSDFKLKASSLVNGNVSIVCQPDASLGFTFIRCHNIEISEIQISHCSANIDFVNISLVLGDNSIEKYLKQNFNQESCNSKSINRMLCYISIACLNNTEIVIYRTNVLHSQGIGIFGVNNRDFHILESFLAYNQINCINFALNESSTSFTVSKSYMMFGRAKSFKLASGLNLFAILTKGLHNMSLEMVEFTNNTAHHGNLYVSVVVDSPSDTLIDVNILINDVMSVQRGICMSGIVVEFYINLDYKSTGLYDIGCCPSSSSWLSPFSAYDGYFSSFSLFDCLDFSHQPKNHRKVNIVLQNSNFVGSCVTIQESKILGDGGELHFKMSNITIGESKCHMALQIIDCDTSGHIQLSDLTIVDSYENIMLINIGSDSCELTGDTSFLSNQGSVSVLSGKILFNGTVHFYGNVAHKYESILQVGDSNKVSFQGEIIFMNNSGRQGGALAAYNSKLYFDGNVSFNGNSADKGGALSLKEGSVIYLKDNTHLIFKMNSADTYGGAIYVEDAGYWDHKKMKCFIQGSNNIGKYNIEFENNSAGKAGAALFGGWIDLCETNDGRNLHFVLNFSAENSVSSDPTRVCICTNSTINRNTTEAHVEIFPGQTFDIKAVAVGQRFGVVPAAVRAETGFGVIDDLQKLQDTDKDCTKLKFTVRSSSRNESMLLKIDRKDLQNYNQNGTVPKEMVQFKLLIFLKDCPLGFEFDTKQNICLCHHFFHKYGVQCNFDSYTVKRNAQQWIGVNSMYNIIIHQHCPFDYCNSYATSLNLSNPDEQCTSSRSGILCGACQPGLSQMLGTSKCKKCSNYWLLLIIVFALVGILLVVGLMLLNLTVTVGTINGLIFYANIIRTNPTIFFPGNTTNTFLSWFIAWLNLDLGIETCFYDGLNAYVKTWLQFSFPLYIWLLVILIIIISKYSTRAANICKKNAVQVLATLFILSYSKLLRVTITVFQPTHLLGGHKVWHYDGNVLYLGKQHIPLMIVALLFFVVFFIPYTLVLFGIQWLQPFSHYKLFDWINKFKPLLDAYTGPYKDKHRYWTGLLLLVRIGLFTVFSTNTTGDPAVNLLAIIVVIVCLFAYLALFAGVYKVWLVNLLEYSSLLNLIILSAGVLYSAVVNRPVHVITQVSVSVALFITVILVGYLVLTASLKTWKLERILSNFAKADRHLENSADNDAPKAPHQVTHSVIELKEPLLEYCLR